MSTTATVPALIETKTATAKTVANASPATKVKASKKSAATCVDEEEVQRNEDETFHEIEKLQEHGVNMADILKLKQSGYCTVLSVLQSTRKDLAALKGFSDAKVEKVLEAAAKLESDNYQFVSGAQLLQKRATVLKLTTGSSALDRLLNGGIESMSITEIFGENRTGKTQICHTLCVTAQLPLELNGGNGKICFIDTEGTFRPEKIGRIAERFGLSGEM